ncbi:uncharacterized protein [Centruroides vittatus]|uniref:uncharacterized protein n=1 Tax=Centruroides vittatus TaxID=120091 RepID=UPI00350FE46B
MRILRLRIFFNVMSYLNCEDLFAGSYLPLGNNFYFNNHQDRMQMPQYGLATEAPELHGFWPVQEVGGYEPPIQMVENGLFQIPEYGIATGTPQFIPSPGFCQYGPVQDVGGWKSLIPLLKNSSWSKVTGYKPALEVCKEKRMTEESNSASLAQVPTYTPSVAFEIEPATEVLVCEPTAECIAETPFFSVPNFPTGVDDTDQTISPDLDQSSAGNFAKNADITEIIEPEIRSNTKGETKIGEISDIFDDEKFFSNVS